MIMIQLQNLLAPVTDRKRAYECYVCACLNYFKKKSVRAQGKKSMISTARHIYQKNTRTHRKEK